MKWRFKIITNKENDQAAQELKILEEEIAAAYEFFLKNCMSHFHGKKKIPVYLILGPARFGKTTILSQAGLDLIDANYQSLNTVIPTKYCSFWFSKEALYIDTAGTYTKPDFTKPRHDLIWQGFIKLLQKYFGKNSLAGTLIVLDLPAITADKTLLKKTLFYIRERIYEMASYIKTLNTHIIFTKCDRILGFTEFFSCLNREERSQPFGIVFAPNKKTDLALTFETKFSELLRQLNNRIIENLQKSIHPKERALIKIFPSQMENLRAIFTEVISKIPHSSQILLSSIYFTSSIQDGAPIDPIKAALIYALNLKEKPEYNLEANNNQSHFVEDVFKKGIRLPHPKQHNKLSRLRLPKLSLRFAYLYALLIALLIIGTSILTSYQSYLKNATLINQVKLALQTQNPKDYDNLYLTLNQLQQNANSWWLTFGINKTKSLQKTLTKTHQVLFIRSLITQLEDYLGSTTIDTPKLPTSQKIYRALQTYLMFGDPEKLEPDYIKNWFNNYWTEIYNNNEKQTILLKQLDSALQNKFKGELNQQLITTIRENLNNLPPTQLIYLQLENLYANQLFKSANDKTVAKMYTKENFEKIYYDTIPKIIATPPQHDWILGKLKTWPKDNNESILKNVRDLYLEKYAAAWENIIKLEAKLDYKKPQELSTYLSALTAQNSPLITLLQQIKDNTNINKPPAKLTKELTTRLQGLNNINLEELQHKLNKLAHFMAIIADNPASNNAAFITLTKYLHDKNSCHAITDLKTFANHQPPLLQAYLLSIINNVWQTLLTATHDHINQAWADQIVPKYKEILENKYPLFKNSKEDISIDDFNSFFGPHGIINNFFTHYIKPLVNAEKTDWTWKNIDDQKINFSRESLEIFLRAALIQKMFYTTKTPKPTLQFTLTPVDLGANTQGFSLHIDGQKISFSSEDKKSRNITWPGPQSGLATISFVNNDGKYITTSEFGPWAWFRMLDKANIVTNNHDTKHFELTFDLNGNASKYTLTTTEPINPFIPDIISDFRCSDSLH
jgi:type VI secretion system protein ImpL